MYAVLWLSSVKMEIVSTIFVLTFPLKEWVFYKSTCCKRLFVRNVNPTSNHQSGFLGLMESNQIKMDKVGVFVLSFGKKGLCFSHQFKDETKNIVNVFLRQSTSVFFSRPEKWLS